MGDPPAIVYLSEGDPAPFSGDLFPPARSIRLGLRIEAAEKTLAAEVEHLNRVHQIELEASERQGQIRVDTVNQLLTATTRALDESQAWWRSPPFVASVAVVLTLATATAVGYTWAELASGVN